MVEGVQNTEIGIIPYDWKIDQLKRLTSDMLQGVNTAIYIPEYVDDGIPMLKANNIIDKTVIFDGADNVSFKTYNRYSERYKLKQNDFLFSNIGARLGTGSLLRVNRDCTFAWNVMRIIPDKSKIDPEYLHHSMNSNILLQQIKMSETGSGMGFVPKSVVGNIWLPLPPTEAEQTAIATALNDADALIQKLEQLIAKKRNIKTGAMQELLKPKEGWKWRTVDKLGKPFGGLSGKAKTDFKDGNCPYIPFMNVMSNPIIDTTYFDYVKIAPTESQHKAEKGDLFFNGSSETPEEVGMCSVLLEDIPNLYLNSFCFGFRLFKEEKNDGLYLAYFFRSSYGRKIFYILAQGATRHNLSKSNFLKIEIQIPEPDEQVKIATIIRDMDNEIQELEKQLEKYKMMKQGMMQSLLTGKIRLV